MSKDVTCKIIETYAILEQESGKKVIYASVAWNGNAPKDEIRMVWTDKDGEEHVGKGIAISDSQMRKLIKAFCRKSGEKLPDGVERPEKLKDGEVNFGAIFEAADGIAELRSKGFATHNGFARLTYADGSSPRKLKDHYIASLKKKHK